MDAGSVVDSANGRSFSTSAVNFEIAGSVSLSRPAARDAGVSIVQSMTQGTQFFELSVGGRLSYQCFIEIAHETVVAKRVGAVQLFFECF